MFGLGDAPVSEWPHVKAWCDDRYEALVDVCGPEWVSVRQEAGVRNAFASSYETGEWDMTGEEGTPWRER